MTRSLRKMFVIPAIQIFNRPIIKGDVTSVVLLFLSLGFPEVQGGCHVEQDSRCLLLLVVVQFYQMDCNSRKLLQFCIQYYYYFCFYTYFDHLLYFRNYYYYPNSQGMLNWLETKKMLNILILCNLTTLSHWLLKSWDHTTPRDRLFSPIGSSHRPNNIQATQEDQLLIPAPVCRDLTIQCNSFSLHFSYSGS